MTEKIQPISVNQTTAEQSILHGRETYAVNFGDGLVMKRPLKEFSQQQKDKWLAKQHKTKDIIDEIKSVNNPRYNIPQMIYIKDDEYQLLEERAPGVHLTPEVYASLTERQRAEIIDSIANFLVDMNELKPVQSEFYHKISDELKMVKLVNIIEKKMPNWFSVHEVKYMYDLVADIENFEYVTRKAWSHADLNSANVLYDKNTSKLSFIDFAEADYSFIYRDIFSPLNVNLGICKPVYATYVQFHDKNAYSMPGVRNTELQNIMQYRIMTVFLKRFIKAGDDLRVKPTSEKTAQNNIDKVRFMRDILITLHSIDERITR